MEKQDTWEQEYQQWLAWHYARLPLRRKLAWRYRHVLVVAETQMIRLGWWLREHGIGR